MTKDNKRKPNLVIRQEFQGGNIYKFEYDATGRCVKSGWECNYDVWY